MTAKLVASFNAGLVERDVQIGIRAYLKRLNDEVFKQPIGAFVDDLLDLVVQDECCIPHDRLVKYGVLSAENLGQRTLRILLQYDLVEGIDFQPPTLVTGSKGGSATKVYYLHPDAFELCLMRAKNTRKYAKFYALLRKCVASYDKYQIARAERQIGGLSAQNCELKAMLQALNAKSDTALDEIKEVKTQNTKILTGLNEVKEQTNAIAGSVRESLTRLEREVDERLDEAAACVSFPNDMSRSGSIVLLKTGPKKYVIFRRQAKSVEKGLNEKRRNNRRGTNIVIEHYDVPNPFYVWDRSRDILKDRIKIESHKHTTFELLPGTEEADVVSVIMAEKNAQTDSAERSRAATHDWIREQTMMVDSAEKVVRAAMVKAASGPIAAKARKGAGAKKPKATVPN